ncbi:unnamed protein product [Mycena citricolor]|uniref:TFIIS N-terminal domain-containing protein n=1 Tax=Mycena citricolor TaxID=2018698 RepID=A0AAD2GTC9_9AGAR|nr:unnamed protein product [Mycena citricolor]CAK5277948.1 unnamed protein product [Mycena citricolor]
MSSDAAELKKLVKQLQSSSSSEDIVSTLRSLRKDFKVNEAILRESKAGLAVGKLRTHASKAVADLAKDVVRQWKVEVEQAKAGAAASKPTLGVNTSGASSRVSPTSAQPP